jgi:fluoride exporter
MLPAMVRTWAAIAAFGAIGSVARYGMDLSVTRMFPSRMPWAIIAVNVLGSFAIGVVFVLFTQFRPDVAAWIRGGVIVGLLGGFTTFSTFSLATIRMLEAGEYGLAIGNVVVSVGAGVAAAAAGIAAGRAAWG